MRRLNRGSAATTHTGAIDAAPAWRRSPLLAKLVLLLLAVMIVRDITVQSWSGGPRPDVTKHAR